jgi:KUP system potassium uptake protein
VALGYLPRLKIEHTSSQTIGQIYIPSINWLLMFAALFLVLEFKSSSNLAAAYGVAVSTIMVITTLLAFLIARRKWRWPWYTAGILTVGFLSIDLGFLSANLVKLAQGGWFPLLVGSIIFTLMTTWKRGRRILRERLATRLPDVSTILAELGGRISFRTPGTAIFMTANPKGAPSALLLNMKHNKSIHEHVLLVTVDIEEIPRVAPADRFAVNSLGAGFHQLILHYGYQEDPDVPAALAEARERRLLEVDLSQPTYFLGRETILSMPGAGMAQWRERLFALMSRNAKQAAAHFNIPSENVMEVGTQIEL